MSFEFVYCSDMDPLSGFLDGPRARSAFLLRAVLAAPWSMRIQDEAPLTLIAVTRGSAWLVPADTDAIALGAGDVAVVRGPDPYVVADLPDTPPSIVIDPGEVCRSLDGANLAEAFRLGVRTWGNRPDGETTLLVGTYLTDGQISSMLLGSLPHTIVLRSTDWGSPLVDVLAEEIGREQPGQQVVLDRLLDLLLVGALRAAFEHGIVTTPAWFQAAGDPLIGEVITRIQYEPAQPWTVAALARVAGVSRALFARRFHERVGQPPMTFVTTWRMILAADLLLMPGATVAGVATAVGYTSPFTFSTAFKRHHGVSPRQYRDQVRSGSAGSGIPAERHSLRGEVRTAVGPSTSMV